MFWSLFQNLGSKGISFIVTLFLARILTPEIFGLIGMLTIFIQVSEALVVAGFNEALIQKKDADEKDYSSVFWLNLGLGLLIYLILFLMAPFISEFYHQPVLTKLTRAFSLIFIINAFSYVQETRLRKEMRFRTLTIIHIPSAVLAAIVSIVMAFLNFGVWSIIAMQLVSQFAYAVQIWIYSKWKPLLIFERSRIKGLFSFGGRLMLATLISTVYHNIYTVVIGRFFPLSSVGYYETAGKVVRTPGNTLSNALNNVAFPAFSSIQSDNIRLKNGYKRIIKQVFFWICPVYILSGVMAVPLFHFVLGTKWLPAVPYFRLLCVTGIFYPLSSYNLAIVNVKGRSDISLRLEIIKRSITTAGIIATIPFGVWALLWFQAANSIFSYILNSHYSGLFIQYPTIEQIKDVLPVFGLSILVGFFAFWVNYFLIELPDWIRLAAGYGAGITLYWAVVRFNRFSAYIEFLQILKSGKSHFLYR